MNTNSDAELLASCRKFLSLLPECKMDSEYLVSAACYFNISAAEILKAAEQLGISYDLSYIGIRALISAYFTEFLKIFADKPSSVAEVSVPSPVCSIMALQRAGKDQLEFTTGALFAKIALHSFLNIKRFPDTVLWCHKRCGLNEIRERLIKKPPVRKPDYLLQWGFFCDECCKSGELLSIDGCRIISCVFSKISNNCSSYKEYLGSRIKDTINSLCRGNGIVLNSEHENYATDLYLRFTKVQKKIAALNSRRGKMPLKGNSFALVETAQIAVFEDWETVLNALELLSVELEAADSDNNAPRLFSFYVPFLQPYIDNYFRSKGIILTGNTAFLYKLKTWSCKTHYEISSTVLMSSVLGWPTEEACKVLSDRIQKENCAAYLTGMYSFDKWLGSSEPLVIKILKERYDIPSFKLEIDFWDGPNIFSETERKIDEISALIV